MPEERKQLVGTALRLDISLAGVEAAEMDRLAEMGEEWAVQTGGIAFDAPEHDELIERVRSLDARPELPERARKAVRGHLERHERVEKNRTDVEAFLGRAGRLLRDRDRLDETAPEYRAQAALPLTWEEWRQDADRTLRDAGALRRDIPERERAAHLAAAGAAPGTVEENAARITDRIERDERARAEAERRRQAAERARAVQEAEQQRLEEERRRDRSEGGGISMS